MASVGNTSGHSRARAVRVQTARGRGCTDGERSPKRRQQYRDCDAAPCELSEVQSHSVQEQLWVAQYASDVRYDYSMAERPHRLCFIHSAFQLQHDERNPHSSKCARGNSGGSPSTVARRLGGGPAGRIDFCWGVQSLTMRDQGHELLTASRNESVWQHVGWEAGIRTPINRTRICRVTVTLPPNRGAKVLPSV